MGQYLNLEPITKDEFDYLVKHNILKIVNRRYKGLITGSKFKHGKNKPRYVEEWVYNKLLELKSKKKG